MTINKQLFILMLLISLFSITVSFSTFKISNASTYHQLNSLHFYHIIELNELINKTPNKIPNTEELRSVVLNIKDQPKDCVDITGTFDHFLLKIINTDDIVNICKNDIKVAEQLLDSITRFEKGEITSVEMKADLKECYDNFIDNSISFIEPVDKLTAFILNTSTKMIAMLSILFFVITLVIAKAISNVVKRIQKARDQLIISEEKNRLLAHKDTLTGLPNRHSLNIKINEMIVKSSDKKFAILFIDLDRFKDINDTKGHALGDKLLITIAHRISSELSDNDFVFRFGGDEFVAILNFQRDVNEIDRTAAKLLQVISEPVPLDKSSYYATASIGISVYPDNADNAESLLKYADIAMYKVKKEGKNQRLFYQDYFSSEHIRRLSYESQLRTAISKDQLSIAYQPVVNLNNFATQSTEALLRWQIDQETIVSPELFIPIAEYSGQIIEIGEWVLRNACEQNKKWRDSGASNLNIGINVSPYQLFNPNFSKSVDTIISDFDIPYHCLELEITESMIVSENERFLKTLNELSEMGVKLLMDDFGTGYSCLSYLRKLPFDVLKIDKSFVTDYDLIASTIIAMGKQLDMKVIAEGVETQKSLTLLQQQKCDFAQGYFFQRPVSAEQLDIFKVYK